MVRAVIFDCFGVLYLDPGLGFYEKEIANFDEIRRDILDIDKRYDYGYINIEQHANEVAEMTGLAFDFVLKNVRGEHVRNERLMAYSQELRTSYKLGMLSNIGKGGMESFFSTDEQHRFFDNVVLSSDVGVIKPNREIFRIAAERLGVEPSECIMIDDRQDNVDGAISAGMQGVFFKTTEQLIREVTDILDRENA